MSDLYLPKAVQIKGTSVGVTVCIEVLPAADENGIRYFPERIGDTKEFTGTVFDWEIVSATAKVFVNRENEPTYGRPNTGESYELFSGDEIYVTDISELGRVVDDETSEGYQQLIKIAVQSLQENINFETELIDNLTAGLARI